MTSIFMTTVYGLSYLLLELAWSVFISMDVA